MDWFTYSLNNFGFTNAANGVQNQGYKDNHTSAFKELRVKWREEKSILGRGQPLGRPASRVWLVAARGDGWEQPFLSASAPRGSSWHFQGLGLAPCLLN